jgi:hypothetical protein
MEMQRALLSATSLFSSISYVAGPRLYVSNLQANRTNVAQTHAAPPYLQQSIYPGTAGHRLATGSSA